MKYRSSKIYADPKPSTEWRVQKLDKPGPGTYKPMLRLVQKRVTQGLIDKVK